MTRATSTARSTRKRLRMRRLRERGCDELLQAARHRTGRQRPGVDLPHGPDADAGIRQKDLLRTLEILATERPLLHGESVALRGAQHDVPHDARDAADVDARRAQAIALDQEHVRHRARYEPTGAR